MTRKLETIPNMWIFVALITRRVTLFIVYTLWLFFLYHLMMNKVVYNDSSDYCRLAASSHVKGSAWKRLCKWSLLFSTCDCLLNWVFTVIPGQSTVLIYSISKSSSVLYYAKYTEFPEHIICSQHSIAPSWLLTNVLLILATRLMASVLQSLSVPFLHSYLAVLAYYLHIFCIGGAMSLSSYIVCNKKLPSTFFTDCCLPILAIRIMTCIRIRNKKASSVSRIYSTIQTLTGLSAVPVPVGTCTKTTTQDSLTV